LLSIYLRRKVRVVEAAKGTGDLCGSLFVNRVFRKWFTDHFYDHEGYGQDALEVAMERFETIAKRKFSGGLENFILLVLSLVDDLIKRVRRHSVVEPVGHWPLMGAGAVFRASIRDSF
jgi:hypothetical protein